MFKRIPYKQCATFSTLVTMQLLGIWSSVHCNTAISCWLIFFTQDPSPTSKLLRFSLTSIRDIETVTGVNFFPNLSTQQQNILELRIANELWTTSA